MGEMIAILEDNADRERAMRDVLASEFPDANIAVFESALEMTDWLTSHVHQIMLISLDNDLPIRRSPDGTVEDCGDGLQVVDFLVGRLPVCPVIVHTSNYNAGTTMVSRLTSAGWPVSRVFPNEDVAWVRREWREAIQSLAAAGWFRDQVVGNI